jgi:hypothetical protein
MGVLLGTGLIAAGKLRQEESAGREAAYQRFNVLPGVRGMLDSMRGRHHIEGGIREV